MKTPRKLSPFITLLLFLLSIGLIGGITGNQISTADASTGAAIVINPSLPTPTSTGVKTSLISHTSDNGQITWKELVSFLEKDHTNWNAYVPGKYTCLEFSMDLVTNARKQGIEAWIVTVEFSGGGPGHAFVAFKTSDRGTVFVEPQADDTYPIVKVGVPLCDAWGVYQCMGKVASIDYVQCANADYCTKFTP